MTSAPLPNARNRELEREAASRVGGLFERRGRMVYGVCRAMLRDVHEAEDATQQVFLSAHKALLGGARVRDSGGWLATIARNECRGRIAAGLRSPLPVADEDLAAIPSPVDEQARHDQAMEFREALAELPERQREAVVLRYLYGLRYGEVATALGLSRPATEALLFRARRGLRGRLRPVVGTVLVVPLALREELALAIPGFSGAGTSAATLGVAGGVLAKLTAAPVGVKVATAAVAVSTVGAVGTVESDRPARGVSDPAPIVASAARPISGDEGRSGDRRRDSGEGEATDDESGSADRSGPSGRGEASDEPEADRSGSSSGSGDGRSDADDSERETSSDEDSGSGGSEDDSETKDEPHSSGSSSDVSEDPDDRSGSADSGEGDSGHSAGSDDSNSGTSGSHDAGSGTSGSEEESEDEPPVD